MFYRIWSPSNEVSQTSKYISLVSFGLWRLSEELNNVSWSSNAWHIDIKECLNNLAWMLYTPVAANMFLLFFPRLYTKDTNYRVLNNCQDVHRRHLFTIELQNIFSVITHFLFSASFVIYSSEMYIFLSLSRIIQIITLKLMNYKWLKLKVVKTCFDSLVIYRLQWAAHMMLDEQSYYWTTEGIWLYMWIQSVIHHIMPSHVPAHLHFVIKLHLREWKLLCNNWMN